MSTDLGNTAIAPEIRAAYRRYTMSVRVRNAKVATVLVILLMPAGIVLDLFVYKTYLWAFFWLRIICSGLAGLVLVALGRPNLVERWHWQLTGAWYVLPSLSISWMIAMTQGSASPYYAGLNLVILAASSVVQATFAESLAAVSIICLMYLGACVMGPPIDQPSIFVNNLYFLLVTSVIVVTGNYFFNRLRFREFTLRHELNESRQKLEESNRKLVELDQIKSRFFANISHELRTPLTLLLAPLESFMREKSAQIDAQAHEWLQTMQMNGMRLLKLINDLLDLVRLESGKVEIKLEPVAVTDFIHGQALSVQKLAQDRKLRFETSVAPDLGVILTDRDKLEKVLLNLLFNAIKFTPPGGSISLQAAREDRMLSVHVCDTGMGISDKQLPHIFDRFWQADSSSRRKHAGTGIGLALVKELVEVQGGSVTASSAEGKGTTISVKIPYRQSEEAAVPAEGAPTEPAASPPAELAEPAAQLLGTTNEWLANLYRRAELFPAIKSAWEDPSRSEPLIIGKGNRQTVLVADDEPDMLRFLKSQLCTVFHVLEASDGQQAIDVAAQFLPDLILCDMMMPEKDGLQVCRELRDRTPTRGIPIVMLTARADEETKLAALSAGANDFLTKPFSGTELHLRLKNLIESHQLQKILTRQKQVLEATLDQLKETELQLVQSEKLASLGRMSAGIIHEINNPINYVKTALFTLRQTGKYLTEAERPEFEEVLRDIEDGINRVRNIVSDLRGFTTPQIGGFQDVELDRTIQLALRFLSSEWKGNVQIQNRVAPDQTVWGSQNQIVQVLVNVLQNAFDALKNKPFATGRATVAIESRTENDTVYLTIHDNGEGIPAEHLGKIFDPFFSTKEVGAGMGLGLSICYRIMRDHHGRISARSEPGKYCEFILEFPSKMTQSTA